MGGNVPKELEREAFILDEIQRKIKKERRGRTGEIYEDTTILGQLESVASTVKKIVDSKHPMLIRIAYVQESYMALMQAKTHNSI